MTVFSNSDPVLNQPYLAINGMLVSNDATTPNTVIDVSAGLCRDSTNTFDINLGNWFGEAPSLPANVSTSINAAINGVNALDTGTLAASKVYYVHVIFDQTGQNQPACLLSLSRTAPLLPAGYSQFRWIGQRATDSSFHFLLTYTSGPENERVDMFDAPQATAITAGHATSYTNVDLTKWVPLIANIPVWVAYSYVPATAGNALSLQPGNATGAAVTVTGQVATVAVTANALVMAQSVTLSTIPSPVINYKESNASDAVALNVAGFQYSL